MFDSLRLDFLTKPCTLPLLSFTLRFPSTWLTSRERNVIIHRENMTRDEWNRKGEEEGESEGEKRSRKQQGNGKQHD